jgi:uncharacterized secreted protein with C-terminal beta-propeller domain
MSEHGVRTVAVVVVLVGSVLGLGAALAAVGPSVPAPPVGHQSAAPDAVSAPDRVEGGERVGGPNASLGGGLGTFANASAFRSYVRSGNRIADGGAGPRIGVTEVTDDTARAAGQPAPEAETAVASGGGDGGDSAAPARVATTNVQVGSLDEPDVVKTDGRHFYYAAPPTGPGPLPVDARRSGEAVGPGSDLPERNTHVVDAADPAAPEAVAAVNATGRLLQTGGRLVVLGPDRLTGYDVSDPAAPTEVWSTPLNGSLVTAREVDGTLYLVTEVSAGPGTPCPIEPLGPDHPVACDEVYRPGTQIPVDATYTVLSVDAADGEVRDTASFVGTSRDTIVYAAPGGLYVTYTEPSSRAAVTAEFLREEFGPTPAHLADRVAEIQSYDISPASREREIRRALDRWVRTLPAGRQESVRREFETGLSTYVGDHQRNLTRTGIVRIGAEPANLTVDATGAVPGRPLDQFSMDRHDGTLRIATTVPGVGAADSENDLYVLDAGTLDRRGSVTGMGTTERIYSVRYVDETAYVVTFRRIDPFHVVDLSDPADPEEVGQLELPGFSSYLHPVDDDHVLGVGEERGKVKTVLFDASDPSDPTIDDSRVFDREWSAVSRSHHAFLMDRRHGVFVLPAGRQSLVVDYTDGSLAVEKTVGTDDPATRARYAGDFLYVFAGDTVAVVDETTWERTDTLVLSG